MLKYDKPGRVSRRRLLSLERSRRRDARAARCVAGRGRAISTAPQPRATPAAARPAKKAVSLLTWVHETGMEAGLEARFRLFAV